MSSVPDANLKGVKGESKRKKRKKDSDMDLKAKTKSTGM